MKALRFVWIWIALLSASAVMAQTATTTPSAPASSINWVFGTCDNRAIVDLTGTMQAGYDVYLQIYRETGARGEALSDVIRVSVNGSFQVSQVINYPAGKVLALGQFASMKISIGSESNASTTIYSNIQDDVYDTCITPAYSTTATSTTATGIGTTGATGTTGTSTGLGNVVSVSKVLKPNGGYLNPVYASPQESVVQIGVRPSQNTRELGRVSDVGIIFAECDQFAGAHPGRLFDTDPLLVFWSWYAKTAQQVRDHLATAQYDVVIEINGAPAQYFQSVNVSPVARREDGNFWAFYTVNMGNGWPPGLYRINYRVTWSQPISDGYASFGPGTENEVLTGHCIFNIENNPYGVKITHRLPVAP